MLRVTQAELSRYRREVDRAADSARDYFRAAISEFYRRYPGATTEDVRVFVLDLMGAALPNFTDMAATLSCDLFDELADEAGFEGGRARLYDTTDWQMVDRKVHYLAGFLNGGDRERFRSEVADLTRYYVRRSAYDNMVENCRGQRVKWARVPTGLETCAFCFMLASRGFAYLSERSAKEGHHGYHDNCDCVVVPGFEGPDGNPRVKIDGYDPEAMYRNWLDCAKTIGIDKSSDPMDGAWKDDERRTVRREVATRDWHWLYTGQAPRPHYENARLLQQIRDKRPHEEKMADLLSAHGFRVEMVDAAQGANGRVADSMIGNSTWEFKAPRGNGFLTIKNQLKSNLYGNDHSTLNPQSDKVVISNVRSNMTMSDMIKGLQVALDPEQGLSFEELAALNEVILLDKDGAMLRVQISR